jgi:hypothetical protein
MNASAAVGPPVLWNVLLTVDLTLPGALLLITVGMIKVSPQAQTVVAFPSR